jgi:hypothetical protein
MFSSIPNGFFDVENMEKLGEMYRKTASSSTNPADRLDPAMSSNTKTAASFRDYSTSSDPYQQAFDIEELRSAYPDANQEKQSIEISLATGQAVITRLKMINGKYAHKTMQDNIDQAFIEDDIKKFEGAGFIAYRVKNDSQILYLTKFNVL